MITGNSQIIARHIPVNSTLMQNPQGLKVTQTTQLLPGQNQLQNSNPIRLQTNTVSNLVALVASQPQSQQSGAQQQQTSSTVTIQDSSSSSGQQSPVINQQQLQQSNQNQISPQTSSQGQTVQGQSTQQSPQQSPQQQSQQVSIIRLVD